MIPLNHFGLQVVDMLMFKTFDDLSEEDITEDPLLVLHCGHAYTTSTMDGHMEISTAYAPAPATASSSSVLQTWQEPLSRSDFAIPKACPDCRALVVGVRRYGRVVLHSQLGLTQRKHAEAVR